MPQNRNTAPEHLQRPLLAALTGGVASGKTRVSDRLAALGAAVVDTDVVARDVVAPGTPGLQAVQDAFGADIIDEQGAMDRRALRRRIFEDPGARESLERILHPLIEREARRRVVAHSDAEYVVLVVPLLVETGLFDDADRVIVVDVDPASQIERLLKRDGIDREQARAMLDAQASREERLAVATDVIDNRGSLGELDRQVDALHERLVQLSRQKRGPEKP